MCGAIPPLPITPSWRGAQLKHKDDLIFTFTFTLFQDLRGGTEEETVG
jgi:hypothetical protein